MAGILDVPRTLAQYGEVIRNVAAAYNACDSILKSSVAFASRVVDSVLPAEVQQALAIAVTDLAASPHLSPLNSAVRGATQEASKFVESTLSGPAKASLAVYIASLGVEADTAPSRFLHAVCSTSSTSPSTILPLLLCGLVAGALLSPCMLLLLYLIARLVRVLFSLLISLPHTTKRIIFSLPPVRSRVSAELSKARASLAADFSTVRGLSFSAIPPTGVSEDAVSAQLRDWAASEEPRWVCGQLSGAVYHARDAADRLAVCAFDSFSLANPLHPGVFRAVRKMEAEVIGMTARLFHAHEPCGALTAGGTESILMAVLAYRERGRALGVKRPNIVAPRTAHAAFAKAGRYLGVEVRRAAVDGATMAARPANLRRLIDGNTVAVVCSAVSFPHGSLDNVEGIAEMARRRGIGCHVDSCLGSFLIPYASRAGFPIPPFDFRVAGVTSISVDSHKYGYAPKGTSIILFRDPALRRHMYSVQTDWCGGLYATATQAGSRPGSLIAGCWAALVARGDDGFLKAAGDILTATRSLRLGLASVKDCEIVGKPALSVVAFRTTTASRLNLYTLLDGLTAKGWDLNPLQNPPCLHACVTLPMVPKVSQLVADVEQVLAEMAAARDNGSAQKPESRQAAIYGMTASVPQEIVREACQMYLDEVLAEPQSEIASS